MRPLVYKAKGLSTTQWGPFLAMRGSRNFRRGGGGGGPGPSDIKSSGNVIFCIYLVLNIFYRSKMVISFPRFQRGSNIFPEGDSNFFQGGGVQLFIPYRNPYIL